MLLALFAEMERTFTAERGRSGALHHNVGGLVLRPGRKNQDSGASDRGSAAIRAFHCR